MTSLRFEVIKHANNRWEARGSICVDYQRWKLDAYSRVFTTKKQAQKVADKLEKHLVSNFDDYMEFQQWRLAQIKEYLASRKERPSASQLKLF